MKQKYEYEKEHESMAFVELVNFIGHEAYRAAVLTQYPDEYNRIISLNNEVMIELKALHWGEMYSYLHDLSSFFVNSIVLEYPFEELEKKIHSVVNQICPEEILYEEPALKTPVQEKTKKIIQVAEKLHYLHKSWCTDIDHRCMPAGLISKVKLEDVINYVESEEYLIETKVINDNEKHLTVVRPPFDLVKMFGDAPKYRFQSQKSDMIPIPENSFFNRYIRDDTSPEDILTLNNETQIQAMVRMSFINKEITEVEFTKSLNVKIDLSSPMRKHEMELLMNSLHHKITHHQKMNTLALLLQAENLEQLEKANQDTDLGHFDLAKHMDLTKYQIKGVSSFTDIKNALLGLMAWNEHFIKIGTDHSLIYEKADRHQDDSFAAVTDKFTDANNGQVRKGYGLSTIKKGYSVVSVAIQRELINQREGRYQKRKASKEREKSLINAPTISLHELHQNDEKAVTDRLNKLASQGYNGLIKRHEDGSLWIVHCKK